MRRQNSSAGWLLAWLLVVAPIQMVAGEPQWWTDMKRANCLPANFLLNNWDGKSRCRGANSDDGAAQREQQRRETERQRQEAEERERKAELERQQRETDRKRLLEEAEMQARFLEGRDATATSLRGSSGSRASSGVSGGSGLRGSTPESGGGVLRGSGQGTGLRGAGSAPSPLPNLDAMVVDARNVPTGLPATVENTIPKTPAGDRIRKGFQAVLEHDWTLAVVWFKDALNHEPGSPGLRRLVDLAEFTLQRHREDLELKRDIELYRAMDDYDKSHPPKMIKNGKKTQSDAEWLKEKDPAWKTFFRMLTPNLKPTKIDKNTPMITLGIRG